MEDGGYTPNTVLQDFDFSHMDEILFDGFWLETTSESNFWQPGPTNSTALNPASFFFPSSDTNLATLNTNPPQETPLKSDLFSYPQMDAFTGNQKQNYDPSVPSVQSANSLLEETEVNRRLWVGPNRNPIRAVSVKKKLVQAINYLKESMRDSDVLVQIWVPVKKEGKQVLTTTDQPFSFNPNCKNLAEYRDVSQTYQFAADLDSKELAGLPGRVFLNKLPEWTPDVRFFRSEEYPRVNYAQHCDVRGSLALPVFERGSGNCLGVVEIVTTSQKLNYRPELENVCKALEAFDLKSSNMLGTPNIEDCTEGYQSVLMEIKNVLKCVCDTHKLPLAQTWAPCTQQGKSGCRHSEENYAHCVSTIDSACYVADLQVSGFHEACSEHHLLKDEGIAGKAFLTNQPCFSEDITVFSKTEYPLAHHARVFNLSAAVAIRLRSQYTGSADYVLEFFLPINCRDAEDQRQMLDSLSSVLQRTCQSLRVVTDEELGQETSDIGKHPPKEPPPESSSWIMNMVEKGKGVAVSMDHQKEEPAEFNVTREWDKSEFQNDPAFLEHEQLQNYSGSKLSAEGSGSFCFSSGNLSTGVKSNTEKRRTKTEKTISLQVLRQYFAGSLKDAAKNIGVCPTTLKRICRQHGISRWPSRKIKKVGHSLKKLQLVIDSVQGAEGSIQLSSFYNNFPELVSSNTQETSILPTSTTVSGQFQLGNTHPEGTLLSPATTTSSGSHSSSSSYCVSTGVKQSSVPINGSNGGMLKRARSDAELHDMGLGQEETKFLVRSYSQKIVSDHALTEAPPVPINNSNKVNDVGYFRVKAAFGEEKIRFSLQPNWGFRDLQKEVFRRFNIDDNGSRVDLKYLDDDNEWVLLTCDADLEECIDIHRSYKSRTIKLSLNQPYYHNSLGSSFGSTGPY
ncbi:hypothetical protein ACS0TY_011661 [Phlomoides rotata]